MKTIAVLGGGPAGATIAERLAKAGVKTVLFDEKLAWEKPCGGGLTYKAYSQYPYLIENDTPKKIVTDLRFATPKSGAYNLPVTKPLVIYSRFDLNQVLLRRAETAGAAIEQKRVIGLDRTASGWQIRTRSAVFKADYCVIATGARNPLRDLATQFRAEDTMYALGYFIPSAQTHIDLQFLRKLDGYIWVFPRPGHVSAGICGKGEPAQSLRARLDRYLGEHGIGREGATFYAHVLPSLERESWHQNRIAGDGWMAVGDAAGLVDPITGEGLYYAIRSADLGSQVLLSDEQPERRAEHYGQLIKLDFGLDLTYAAGFTKKRFLGPTFFRAVPDTMIKLMRRSATFCEIIEDLVAGTQSYLEVKDRVLRDVNLKWREMFIRLAFLSSRRLRDLRA